MVYGTFCKRPMTFHVLHFPVALELFLELRFFPREWTRLLRKAETHVPKTFRLGAYLAPSKIPSMLAVI